MRTASELRGASAARMREMAAEGTDAELQGALLVVAEEFGREAERLDAEQTHADR
jgi:hypothetical protein